MANNILRLNKLFNLPKLTKYPSLSESTCVNYSKSPRRHSMKFAKNKNKQESIDKQILKTNRNEQSIQILANKLSNQPQDYAKIIDQNFIKIKERIQYNISLAFREGNIDAGFKFFQEFIQAGKTPNSDIFEAYWSYCHQANNLKQNVIRMLQFIEKNCLLLSRESANGLKLLLEPRDIAINEVKTSTRMCPNCNKPLMGLELTIDEYNQLKRTVEQNILRNYLNPPPMELIYLKQTILKKRSQFDVVIDGLNVAYYVDSSKTSVIDQAKMVQTVIRYFAEQGKRILFIGRKHMECFPDDIRKYINKNSTLLLINDRMSDDQYLLYATIWSGYNTHLLSRDMMRDHMQLLDPIDRELFLRWQQEHQYSFNINAKGQFELEQKINAYPHRIDNIWHIPCANEFVIEHSILTPPTSWLCVKF